MAIDRLSVRDEREIACLHVFIRVDSRHSWLRISATLGPTERGPRRIPSFAAIP